MGPPVVTRQHLEKAWLEATGAATMRTPVHWNTELVRTFVREAPTVASIMLAAGQKRFQNPERTAVAQWIAAWLYRAYQLSGATFSPLDRDELISLLTREQEHLVQVSKLDPTRIDAAEKKHFREIPNGDLLEMLMQMWGKACFQLRKQGEPPVSLAQDTYHARLHLAVTLRALNLSAEKAG